MLFFTADQHYNHRNIIQYCSRPFHDLVEMNEALVQRHNAVVSKDDTVVHLGDIAWDGPGWVRRLNGKHFLVPGNHDTCHPCHKRYAREVRWYCKEGLTVLDVQFVQELGLGFPPVLLCHFPFYGDMHASEERYKAFRPTALPLPARLLLHGHVHTAWKRRGICINVGVDVWDYAPVSVDQLVAYCQDEGVL